MEQSSRLPNLAWDPPHSSTGGKGRAQVPLLLALEGGCLRQRNDLLLSSLSRDSGQLLGLLI